MNTSEIILSFLFAVALSFAVFFFYQKEQYRKALNNEQFSKAAGIVVSSMNRPALPLPVLVLFVVGGALLFRHLRNTSNE